MTSNKYNVNLNSPATNLLTKSIIGLILSSCILLELIELLVALRSPGETVDMFLFDDVMMLFDDVMKLFDDDMKLFEDVKRLFDDVIRLFDEVTLC